MGAYGPRAHKWAPENCAYKSGVTLGCALRGVFVSQKLKCSGKMCIQVRCYVRAHPPGVFVSPKWTFARKMCVRVWC